MTTKTERFRDLLISTEAACDDACTELFWINGESDEELDRVIARMHALLGEVSERLRDTRLELDRQQCARSVWGVPLRIVADRFRVTGACY